MKQYIVYPEAEEIIRKSGLDKRIKETNLGYLGGYVFKDEFPRIVKELKEEGYYQHIPENFKQQFYHTLNQVFSETKDHYWTIHRHTGLEKDKADNSDIDIFIGNIASCVLEPEELWDHEKFGFNNPTELIGALSVYMMNESRPTDCREGYVWITNRANGEIIKNNITGNSDSDLLIEQKNIAPYKTIDIFGNETRMRPLMRDDFYYLAGSHSVEDYFLASILKYIDQEGIETETYKDNAKSVIEWAKSLGQRGGSTTEHLSPNIERPEIVFTTSYTPMPRLDKDYQAKTESRTMYSGNHGGYKSMYIGPDKELIFSGKKEEGKIIPSAYFLPEEADHLIKGLLYQAARGLGRTPARQLINILEYRFSERFDKSKEEYNQYEKYVF